MPRLPVTVAAFSFAAINAIAISGPDSIQVAPTIDPSTRVVLGLPGKAGPGAVDGVAARSVEVK